MIQESSLHGTYLGTQQRRRLLVAGYYALILSLTVIALGKPNFFPGALLVQTLALGALFGGIRRGGPVKPFSDDQPPLFGSDPDEEAIQLHLGRSRGWFESSLLDERETAQRDRAHYTAFHLLRWLVLGAAVLYWLGYAWRPAIATHAAPVLLWPFVILILSLPQAVILWTEQTLPPS